MTYKFEEGKDAIINAVISEVMQQAESDTALCCAEFVRQFYGTMALEDLQAWDKEDLYGAAINFWNFISTRASKQTKIRIYNPDFEQHGWQTTHTVVEIITEDMPFLVDSVSMVITRMGLSAHLIIQMETLAVQRNAEHKITTIFSPNGDLEQRSNVILEAPLFFQIDKQTDPVVLETLNKALERALADNQSVVEDWMAMREKVSEIIQELDNAPKTLDPEEVSETKAFLSWIEDHHFTFLGVRDYEVVQHDKETLIKAIKDSGLGVLRRQNVASSVQSVSDMTPEARQLSLSNRILVMSKTNTLATVHRNVYSDYIGVKRFNDKGEIIGERRIIGLYTAAAYNTSPRYIPFLRHKVTLVMNKAQLNPKSHMGKVLLNILETLPRDDLIQATEDELLIISMGIFHMQERRKIRLFARMDAYRRFVSCLVFVPKDQFNTQLREVMERILLDAFHGKSVDFSTRFSESVLARIHFIVRLDSQEAPIDWDLKAIEQTLVEACRTWIDDLQDFLIENVGEERGNLWFNKYKHAFPVAYCDNFIPRIAVYDIKHIETLSETQTLVMSFYKPASELSNQYRLKLYQRDNTIPLSDVLPIIEQLGMRAISERPYPLRFADGSVSWINDFSLQYTKEASFEIDDIKERFQNAFASVWFRTAENDGFNQLVLGAGLEWQQVAVLRAYAKYFKQIGLTFSQEYIETALYNNAAIAKKLVHLFETRFQVESDIAIKVRETTCKALSEDIYRDLDEVSNLDEDKIIRQYVQAILATLRTNYYQQDAQGKTKSYLSMKLNSKIIPGLPKPHPLFEIFVYAPDFEGVHLRCGKVARGGLRWSDRREDFRTEILGLMKAQQVKNAVIVPSGAKGGFVPKYLPVGREAIQAEGIRCYRQFIRGLLDVTDNYVKDKVIKPHNVICFDEDDPYLVVAADKGTATFSDIANEISLEYQFWLGDAFASGGSVGYDHKKMGITARGAWESVKRNFYEMGVDIHTTDFTVVGIGDMAGDVFGNGMLMSEHIKLLAAFNHQHIFLDPSPDPLVSFKERLRLFHLPRSTWMDYDEKCISKGGGVFSRQAKSISLSKELRQCFGITNSEIEPNELIHVLLKANVDLLWSGGIGTFVKATSETHADVGDRSNDAIRVNANELSCKMIGEGGNLGVTQLARVEYARQGGLIYTDFIDNSAGVNCSDKEVNIKIFLNHLVMKGDLTMKQRNQLLSEMTDEVAHLVLQDNIAQTRAISLAASQERSMDLQTRYILELERSGKIDRHLEYIPDDKALLEQKLAGYGLGRPSVSVLLCYSKTILKEEILASTVPEDTYLRSLFVQCFPLPLQKKFKSELLEHPLRREIIATKLSNIIVNEMGFTFVYRMQDETGVAISSIVKAYMIAREVLHIESLWQEFHDLESVINAKTQYDIMTSYVRLVRRVTRWILREERLALDISKAVSRYEPSVVVLKNALPGAFSEVTAKQYKEHYDAYIKLGISPTLSHEFSLTRALFSAMDIIEVSHELQCDVVKVAEVYFALGERLDITWIRSHVIAHPTENQWESLSREALRDDLDWQQRTLTLGLLRHAGKNDWKKAYETWTNNHKVWIERWKHIIGALRSSTTLNYVLFFVAIRELLDLTQATVQLAEKE
ncbi:MAG: NAD-glutamate dehydrogenase [Legionellaceae bacterium]|nr:NAD-glutamate dehydrogenase [Legionellaceae bacterium]